MVGEGVERWGWVGAGRTFGGLEGWGKKENSTIKGEKEASF